jgi:hypothetical protein
MNDEPDDRLVQELVRIGRASLDANAVAAAVAGPAHRPDPDALACDPEAVLLQRTCVEEGMRRRRRLATLAAAAAVAVLGFGAWFLRPAARGPAAGTASTLAAAATHLQRVDPASFAGFVPLTAEELTATSGARRGGAAWLSPRGVLLDAPTTLRWRPAEGAGRTDISIEGAGTAWRTSVEGDSHPAPVLLPGRYVVTLRAVDALAGQTTRASFVIATPQEREVFERAVQSLRAHTAQDLRDLLEAHYALATGHREAAAAAAHRAAQGVAAVRAQAEVLLEHLDR